MHEPLEIVAQDQPLDFEWVGRATAFFGNSILFSGNGDLAVCTIVKLVMVLHSDTLMAADIVTIYSSKSKKSDANFVL